MIAHISGTVTDITLTHAVIDVQGIGYLIALTGATIAELSIGQTTTLSTYLVVREDVLDLYGFKERAERDFFLLLLSVSGIGPKSALGIIDKGHYRRLRQALAQGDVSYLTKMAGIGSRTAQKLILELREKIGSEPDAHDTGDSDALEALSVLGYTIDEGRAALQSISTDIIGTEQRVRLALKMLGKK